MVQALGHLSAISSAGSLNGEWVLGQMQVGREGGKNQQTDKTGTYNNINSNKVVVELG